MALIIPSLYIEIGSSHFARKLVHEMLADNPDNRISSSDVVDKLQSIEKEVLFIAASDTII